MHQIHVWQSPIGLSTRIQTCSSVVAHLKLCNVPFHTPAWECAFIAKQSFEGLLNVLVHFSLLAACHKLTHSGSIFEGIVEGWSTYSLWFCLHMHGLLPNRYQTQAQWLKGPIKCSFLGTFVCGVYLNIFTCFNLQKTNNVHLYLCTLSVWTLHLSACVLRDCEGTVSEFRLCEFLCGLSILLLPQLLCSTQTYFIIEKDMENSLSTIWDL